MTTEASNHALHKTSSPLLGVARIIGVTITLGLIVASVTAFFSGVRAMPVLTHSMRPTYPPGTLAITTAESSTQVHVGDVIAFMPPAPYATPHSAPVMHRVVSEGVSKGRLWLKTKGDANPAADLWTIDLTGKSVHHTITGIPFAGHLVAAVENPVGPDAYVAIAGLVLLALALVLWPRKVGKTCQLCDEPRSGAATHLVDSVVYNLAELERAKLNRKGANVLDQTLSTLFTDRRIAALEELGIGTNTNRSDLDWITELAKTSTECAIGVITLIGKNGRYCPAGGMPWDLVFGTDREHLMDSTCVHVAIEGEPLVINNLFSEGLSDYFPDYARDGIMSYLGVPLFAPDGTVLGALCVADFAAREWLPLEVATMERLASAVVKELVQSAEGPATPVRGLNFSNTAYEYVPHELRTPLTSIVASIELLIDESDALSPHQHHLLSIANRNTARLSEVVQTLLVESEMEIAPVAVASGALLAHVERVEWRSSAPSAQVQQ